MHISDGILTSEVIIIISIIATVSLIYSLRGLKNEDISILSAMSALFFISSFIHIPIGPTQIHLVLLGVIGVVLGRSIFLSISIALLLQATLLGYGGISSLGANLLIMASPSYFIYLIVKNGFLNFMNVKSRYFAIGFLTVFLSTILLTLILGFSKNEYIYASYIIFVGNIPAMIIEGLITLFLLNYIKKTMPKLLSMDNL